MISEAVESEIVLLKPLSLDELMLINRHELKKVDPSIEQDALLGEVELAISKKIDKMLTIAVDVHDWFTYWLIISKSSYKGIGFIGLKGVPDENGYSEIGYSIAPNYRGKGYMTEALSLIIEWASKFPTCKGITATNVLKTNIGSTRVLHNCHFKLVGSSNEHNHYRTIFEKLLE